MNARRWALAALGTVALMGAGCSNAPSETDTDGGGGASTGATGHEQAVRFAECIRAHDVPDFPDPDAKGEFTFGVNVSEAVWTKAVDACRDLQPPGTFDVTRNPEEQSAALRFAECMRESGVEDFPDPVDGEPLVNTNRIPSSARPGGMDILNAAMQKCRDVGAESAGGQG